MKNKMEKLSSINMSPINNNRLLLSSFPSYSEVIHFSSVNHLTVGNEDFKSKNKFHIHN